MKVPDYCLKKVLILGCGNMLLGDDGFGPAVVEKLRDYNLPSDACALDVGTGVRSIIFNLLLTEKRPEKVIIIDSIDLGKTPGEIFEISIEEIQESKIDDFNFHLPLTSNLLRELKGCGVEVIIIACQVEDIPDVVKIGLSKPVLDAIPKACMKVMQHIS
ncbi:coenzyme F420 hydrogenase [Archaeoglobales archaeon]|nr:MAG: coenzyme F420 hydrogenase [Archaeoglobales archaeon]